MTATTPQDASRTSRRPAEGDHCTLAGRAFHLIGIGGAGMSVVAQLLAARGAQVSGSDAHGGPAFDHLADLGITTHLGHDAANVPERSTVVVSTAIKETNPELAEARRRGQDVIHRSQALALAAQGLDFVAVAGAHGKTTTSGMLAEALTEAGADPSFAIGGVVRALGTGAHLGSGPALVAEADESDRSFLNYTPRVEIVTNVEPDHLDTYGTTESTSLTGWCPGACWSPAPPTPAHCAWRSPLQPRACASSPTPSQAPTPSPAECSWGRGTSTWTSRNVGPHPLGGC